MNRNAARVFAAAAASLLLVSCGGSENDSPAPVPLFSTVVVVGSSVVDTGNRCGLPNDPDPLCFPVPPYAGKSTASNGQLYDQILAARYGAPLVASRSGGFNYAYNGARTGVIPLDTVAHAVPNLQIQTEQFLVRVGYQANPQFLYIVDGAAFGNNVRRAGELIAANPALAATLPGQAVAAAAGDILNVVARLYAAGARHVLLTNVNNLALVPAIAAAGAAVQQLATGMSAGYNGALASQVVPGLRAGSPGLNIYYLDVNALTNEIVANPASFGFTNTQMPCYPYIFSPNPSLCATPDTYLWWDELHPTAPTHVLLAQRAVAAIGR
jgi:outer membrane lipase/esterase